MDLNVSMAMSIGLLLLFRPFLLGGTESVEDKIVFAREWHTIF